MAFPRIAYALAVAVRLAVTAGLVTAALAAQTPALRIVVVAGEAAVNVIEQKTAVAPVVEIRDRNGQPVAGAIVRFAITKGRATFNGARAINVTTNAAGRAVASGLAPTGSGALQIGATATFQGQTAAISIAQTNVMTAAQAAQVAAGGSAGGGGGLSATTIGIVGGAAAGGVIASKELLKQKAVEMTFEGSLSGAETLSFAGPPPCSRSHSFAGNLHLSLDVTGSTVSGDGSLTGSASITTTTCATGPGAFSLFLVSGSGDVSGSTANFTFEATDVQTPPSMPGETHTVTWAFAGAIAGDTVTGQLTRTIVISGVRSASTSSIVPVTLVKQ